MLQTLNFLTVEDAMRSVSILLLLCAMPLAFVIHFILSFRINRVFDPDWPEHAAGAGVVAFSFLLRSSFYMACVAYPRFGRNYSRWLGRVAYDFRSKVSTGLIVGSIFCTYIEHAAAVFLFVAFPVVWFFYL